MADCNALVKALGLDDTPVELLMSLDELDLPEEFMLSDAARAEEKEILRRGLIRRGYEL